MRRALEELAVQLACDRMTKEGMQELKQAAKEFEALLGSASDITAVAEADVAFHDLIYLGNGQSKIDFLVE